MKITKAIGCTSFVGGRPKTRSGWRAGIAVLAATLIFAPKPCSGQDYELYKTAAGVLVFVGSEERESVNISQRADTGEVVVTVIAGIDGFYTFPPGLTGIRVDLGSAGYNDEVLIDEIEVNGDVSITGATSNFLIARIEQGAIIRGDVEFESGAGIDSLIFRNAMVYGNVTCNTRRQFDSLRIENSIIFGGVDADLGAGGILGGALVVIDNTSIGQQLDLFCGGGLDDSSDIRIDRLMVYGETRITLRDGADAVDIDDSIFEKSTVISGGGGFDRGNQFRTVFRGKGNLYYGFETGNLQ